ncbi:MAG: hypothetical protein ACXV2C_00270 [Candidatus Bathyarchaeia archaeon]
MATKLDIVIDQGTTFSTVINLVDISNNPVSLSGFTSAAQMKKWYTSLNHVSFITSINSIAGTITLQLPASTTANIVHGKYVYDVDIIDASNNITRAVEGIATVTPGVTNITVETTPNTYNSNTDFVVVPLDAFSNGNPAGG